MRRLAAERETRRDAVQGPQAPGHRSEIWQSGLRGRFPRGHEGLEGRVGRGLAAVAHHGVQLGEDLMSASALFSFPSGYLEVMQIARQSSLVFRG